MEKLQSIGKNVHDKNDSQISELLLFGISLNNDASNACILNAIIEDMLATKRFDVRLTHESFEIFTFFNVSALPSPAIET